MTTTEKRNNPMSGKDILDFNAQLERVMTIKDGHYVYNEGWNDERVQREFKAGKFTLSQVKKNRVSLGFKMPKNESIFTTLINKHNQLVEAMLAYITSNGDDIGVVSVIRDSKIPPRKDE